MLYDSLGPEKRTMDTLTRIERSKRMALIRSKDTKPELLVREIARSCGYRFRLHVSDLPGKPDIVFPKRKKVIFIHGCFWHRHPGCALARLPKSKLDFWVPKLTKNRRRDLRNIAKLRRDNWRVAVVWECQLKKPDSLEKRIKKFLEQTDAKR
jgi:DNA mismatch endonuclease, patch repair protein